MKRLKKAIFWFGNLFSVFLFACHAQGLNDGDEVCTSGQGDGDGNSECLPIRRCPQMFQLIRGGYRPRNCGGFEGRDPIVCCPRPGPDGGHTGTRKTPAFDNVQSTRAPTSNGKQPIRRPSVKTRAPGETAWKWCNRYQSITCKNHASLEKVVPPLVFAVGGVSAGKDEFPHMAAVGYGDQNDIIWGCGGTLISEYFVLTAAHCLFYSRRGPAKWIRLGTILIQDELRGGFDRMGTSLRGQTHPVIERIPHPGYKSPSKYNDLGLLKIGPALEPHVLSTLSRTIHPACLQVKEESFQELVATGWGRLGQGEEPSPDLQKVTLNLFDNSHCNRTFDIEIRTTSQLQKGIDNSLICAGYLRGGKDTCKGDSGGPLQRINHLGSCMHQVVGITSFGKLCGFEDSPAVYTRVSFFVEWIESHVWPQE